LHRSSLKVAPNNLSSFFSAIPSISPGGVFLRLRGLCKENKENNSRSSFGSQSVGSPSTSRTGDVP